MGRYLNDGYEATIELTKSFDEVWPQLATEVGTDPSWLRCWPAMQADAPRGEVIAVDSNHIRVRKLVEPCKDTVIVLRLTSKEGGSQLTMRQDELPEWARRSKDTFVLGGDQIAADLAIYLQRGILMSRHSLPWSFAGVLARETDEGLEVTAVIPGAFAARVGLEVGDLLLTFGGAPVFTLLCLQAMQRVFKTGDTVELTWLREAQEYAGTGCL